MKYYCRFKSGIYLFMFFLALLRFSDQEALKMKTTMIHQLPCCGDRLVHPACLAKMVEMAAMAIKVNPVSLVNPALWVLVVWMVYPANRALKARPAYLAIRDHPVRKVIAAILDHRV